MADGSIYIVILVLTIVIDLAITSLVLLILGDALAFAISMVPKCRKGSKNAPPEGSASFVYNVGS